MPDQERPIGSDELQFDRATTASSASAAPARLSVICAACHASIETEYYHINGNIFCSRCRTAVESAARTPQGVIPLITAGVFGFGAGVVGAVIYYAVIAIAHIEVGIVAILIGYMVGYAVRKGARGRGGLRFQVVAVLLTYASVALAYTPIAVRGIASGGRAEQATARATTGADSQAGVALDSRPATTTRPNGGRLLLAAVFLLAFIAALPVLTIVSSFPSGLISAFIIFIGMRQAWRMTGAPRLEVLGPYRVGAAPVSTPA
jgi:hypothetical protein